ncbi:MAG: hypothetical protein KZQ63_05175, partial [Candidatus Thiodiazotropha sp. (ex Lucinoma aequizonata)]|nr:hypothetical protein [Candidatus Thiodiazotropha sp. (ex Lucinoma aequizonata)]
MLEKQGGTLIPLHYASYVYIRSFINVRSKLRGIEPQGTQETDSIFEEVHQVNSEGEQDDGILRISLDTKATVKVGPFSRGGYSRQGERAYDHNFAPEATLTPFGILLPKTGDNHLWFSQSKVT